MIADILAGLARANLAASAAVLLVMLLRSPVRKAFGARVAYGLWAMVPLAAIGVLAPRPQGESVLAPMVLALSSEAGGAAAAVARGLNAGPLLLALWAAGALAALALLAMRQAQFMSEVRAGRGGPAVVGFLRPRIVTPIDFESRFAAEERRLILAHEAVHLERGDAAVNALAALAQCAAWFNPLVHIGARLMRIEQELACDAAVLACAPTLRRRYAEVLLKTQLATHPLPIGCQWPASAHPLKERIAVLSSPLPPARRRVLGVAAVTVLSVASACAAWAAQPGATPALIATPDWAERPTGEDIKWAYPAGALAQRLEGRATLACGVAATGRLVGCEVASEAPADAGFGQAALALSPTFQMKPMSRDGVPTRGGSVRIPIRFMVP